MDNSLNKYYVTVEVSSGGKVIHTQICPKSLVGDQIMLWNYPNSVYTVRVLDADGNVKFTSSQLPY